MSNPKLWLSASLLMSLVAGAPALAEAPPPATPPASAESATSGGGAAAAPRQSWRFTAEADPVPFLFSGAPNGYLAGVGFGFGVRPGPISHWHFGAYYSKQRVFLAGLAPANEGWHLSLPAMVEVAASYALEPTGDGFQFGARFGLVHFHAEHPAVVGLTEYDRLQLSATVGYQWVPLAGVTIKPWFSAGLPVTRGKYFGEIEIAPVQRTFREWPSFFRLGLLVGYQL